MLGLCLFAALLPYAAVAQEVNASGIVAHAKALYQQRKWPVAELEKAAATGDVESQLFLAKTLHGRARMMTPEAYYWYEKAAEEGDIYAMYRLGHMDGDICNIAGNCPVQMKTSSAWRKALRDTLKERAADNDGEAMQMIYRMTGDLGWLKAAAAAGYAQAQWALAIKYKEGAGYFWPGQRSKAIETLLAAAAAAKHPAGIVEYAGLLLSRGQSEEAASWLLEAVNMSYVVALSSYSYSLANGTHYSAEVDLKRAYAFDLILSSLSGGGGMADVAMYSMKQIKPRLAPEELDEAHAYAAAWQASHPPLSFYLPK